MMMILQPLIRLMDIHLGMIQIKPIRLLFKISTSHCFEQHPQHHHQQITVSTVPQSRKARGQVTVAWIVKDFTIHSNHSESLLLSVETVFTPVKANYSPWFQQSSAASMLLPAYLKEPTPQSSAGSKLLPQQTEVSQRGSIF